MNLRPMDKEDFKAFSRVSIPGFAEACREAWDISPEQALSFAKKSFHQALYNYLKAHFSLKG